MKARTQPAVLKRWGCRWPSVGPLSRPLEEIQRLYDFVGVDLTPEARAEMERWRDMNRREARPTHQYTLEEYGFTEEGLKNTFREYRERYILSRRPG